MLLRFEDSVTCSHLGRLFITLESIISEYLTVNYMNTVSIAREIAFYGCNEFGDYAYT